MINEFRQTMQRLTSPTAIITSSALKSSSPTSYHGLTIASIASLSINPKPLLQFNLQLPSHTSDSLRAHGLFGVHLLKPNSRSISLIKRFSQGTRMKGSKPFKDYIEGRDYSLYNGIASKKDGSVLPLLVDAERILVCEKKNVITVADHEIWVGEVVDVIANGDDIITGGVLHCNRQFYKLGDKIES